MYTIISTEVIGCFGLDFVIFFFSFLWGGDGVVN